MARGNDSLQKKPILHPKKVDVERQNVEIVLPAQPLHYGATAKRSYLTRGASNTVDGTCTVRAVYDVSGSGVRLILHG